MKRARVIVGAALAGLMATAPASGDTSGERLPPLSTLPRMRELWSASSLGTDNWRFEGAPVQGGVVVGRTTGPSPVFVALEMATGRERWRAPMPSPHVQIELDERRLFATSPKEGTTALDLRTGKRIWSRAVCPRVRELESRGDLAVAICDVAAAEPPLDLERGVRVDAPTSWSKWSQVLVALDPRTGRELWRAPVRAVTPQVRIGRQGVYLAQGMTLEVLDGATGRSLRSFKARHQIDGLEAEPGGRDLVLLFGQKVVTAMRPSDGGPSWFTDRVCGNVRPWGPAVLAEGRVIDVCGTFVRELDLGSGAEAARWSFPVPQNPPTMEIARVMRHELFVAIDGRAPDATWVARIGKAQKALAFETVPAPYLAFVAASDGVMIFRRGNGLVAYDAFATEASEEATLPPKERARTILSRSGRWLHRGELAGPEARAALTELRAVPNVAAVLASLARESGHPRTDALDAMVALQVPGYARLLLAELARPLPPAARPSAFEYEAAFRPRAEWVMDLADSDDPEAADRLGRILIAERSPDGLDARSWRVWGDWDEDGYGRPSWDGPTLEARRLLRGGASLEAVATPCIASTATRPAMHAAVYRMLARLGRPRDLAVLKQLDREQNGAGDGWAGICAADDALGETSPTRLPRGGSGLCRGVDAGEYRVTQAEALWARRRSANGSFGPPAWVNDLVENMTLKPHRLDAATLVDGGLALHGNGVEGDVDPRTIFADADRDGLPDATETVFGTDPNRADTDGDGLPDGRDPAPHARPPKEARAAAVVEIVRYMNLFLLGGPLVVHAPPEDWGDTAGAAGVVLYRRPGEDAQPPFCASAMTIEALQVNGDEARAIAIALSDLGGRPAARRAHRLRLRVAGGVWRVVGDEPAQLQAGMGGAP